MKIIRYISEQTYGMFLSSDVSITQLMDSTNYQNANGFNIPIEIIIPEVEELDL